MSDSSAPNGSPPTYLMFDGIDNFPAAAWEIS
jgi:hypothetical protein